MLDEQARKQLLDEEVEVEALRKARARASEGEGEHRFKRSLTDIRLLCFVEHRFKRFLRLPEARVQALEGLLSPPSRG